jgi:heptosyltransferase-2
VALPWEAWVRRGVTQPIARPVPADDARFLACKGPGRIALRLLRRELEVALSGQARHERSRIDPGWRRALWIHAEAPQIGDALMDLAPRSLLTAHGIAVDLLAARTVAALFTGDRHFGRALSDPASVRGADHDFAIVDSRSWKALASKRRRLPSLPWVSLKGDYLAYDYHRGLLAARRVAALLGTELDARAEAEHARQKLCLGDETSANTEPGHGTVALALGGVQPERTYRSWPAVAAGLHAHGVERFLLLGSDNGRAMAEAVRQRLPEGSWLDLVGRTDLHTTRRSMRQASLVLAADGGLMHLALTTPTPVLALFDASVDPAWRLPPGFAGQALRADRPDVNGIEPDRIEAAALALLGRGGEPGLNGRR